MITVKPTAMVQWQNRQIDALGIYREKRQCFKTVKTPERGNFFFPAKQHIFRTDSVPAGTIQSGFIGKHHTRFQGFRILIQTDRLRSFMDIQVMSDTVSRSMQLSQPLHIKVTARQYIQLRTARIFRKNSRCQVNISHQNKRKISLFLLSGCS